MTGLPATMSDMETLKSASRTWADLIRQHVPDVDALPPAPPATGLPESPEDRAERLRLQAQNRAGRWLRRLPVMYREASLDDLDDAQHAAEVRGWLAGGGATLLLAGPVGTGKTHAAYAVGHQAVDRGLWVEAWTMSDLLEALRPGGDDAAADAVRSCHVLLLDDLGTAKVSDWAVEQFTSLLDHRLRMGLRQVVTTNAGHADLMEAWGARALDRLAYRWTVLAFTGTSRRTAAW